MFDYHNCLIFFIWKLIEDYTLDSDDDYHDLSKRIIFETINIHVNMHERGWKVLHNHFDDKKKIQLRVSQCCVQVT